MRNSGKDRSARTALWLLSACSAALALAPATALAQEEPGGDQADASAEDRAADRVIVVTAQFRETDLQTTPLAITAMNTEMMDARGIASVTQVAQSAPSVTLAPSTASRGKSVAAYIRGIGQEDFIAAKEPGVGIYIDDVYFSTVFGSAFDLVDPERIEVLRGPQGTLAGKNSIGGALKIFSTKPDGDGGGFVSATYGSHSRIDIRAAANFTLVPDEVFVRVSGIGRHGGGYVERLDYGCLFPASGVPAAGGVAAKGCELGDLGDDNVVAGRVHVRALPADGLEINLVADVTEDNSSAAPETLLSAGPSPLFPFFNNAPFVPADPYVSYAAFTRTLTDGTVLAFEPKNRADGWGVSGTIDYDFGNGFSLKSITAYREVHGDFSLGDGSPLLDPSTSVPPFGIPSVGVLFNLFMDTDQFTQELRLNGAIGESFNFTVGGFYFKGHVSNPGRAFSYAVFDFFQDDQTTNRSAAAFVQGELTLTPQLHITAGARYTNDKKTYMFVRSSAGDVPYGLFGPLIIGLSGAEETFSGDRLDYRLAIDYEITPDVMIYGQVASGYKGGGLNPRPFFPGQVQAFGPETVRSYEAGLKSQLFDRRVRLNLAAFYSDYKDIQQDVTVCSTLAPPDPDPLCQLVLNAGDAHIQGIEAETTLEPVDGFLIDGSASYLDFDYTRKVAGIGTISAYTPKWKAAIGAQYEADMGEAGSLTPRIDWIYQSSFYSDVANTAPALEPGRSVFNGRLSWRSSDESWEISAAVTNIFDKYYNLTRAVNVTRAYGFVGGIPGRPREWSVTVKRTF